MFRFIVVLSLVLAVGVAGYLGRLREVHQGYQFAVLTEHRLRQEHEAGATLAFDVDAERRALEEMEQRLRAERWRLAAGEGISELLDQLAVSGHEHGLLFERLEVLEERQEAGYRRLPLDIQVKGSYPALHAWLVQWLGQLRLLTVPRLNVSGGDERAGIVSARLQVDLHHPGEPLEPPDNLADEPARSTYPVVAFDPFQAGSDGSADPGLGRIPLEQLEMVGSLSGAGGRQALLRSAGRLYRVAAGEPLGRDEGFVVSIDAEQVEVRERLFIGGAWQERSRYLALGKSARGEVKDEIDGAGERDAGAVGRTGNAGG
ncbi:pilus assembly protein PilP [Pseudomonas entomophila]|uniref:pilus assembly protein PilP n=1 Tax=Pseudomonas entomophila TaxID=312306 RepID=UPI001BCAA803|nr:pilus assembly protein PilP [Pseudomonas entomophila]QVM91746.1 pilus assembly protein PilP [Pseudomonas entomophila]